MESQVGQSAVVPEYQECPGNNALIVATYFLESERNHKPNQANNDRGRPQPCFQQPKILAASAHHIVTVAQISWRSAMFKSSLSIH